MRAGFMFAAMGVFVKLGAAHFDAAELASVAARIERLGGRHLASRDMGAHGSVATFADPEGNLFQLRVRPGPPA